MAQELIVLELEIDSSSERTELSHNGTWHADGVTIVLSGEEEGHGFGLSEVISIAITIGTGVASDIVADSIRTAVGKVIRRAKGKSGRSDGTTEGLRELVETERSADPAAPETKE